MTGDYTAGPLEPSRITGGFWRTIYRNDEPVASFRLDSSIPFDAGLAQDICAALWAHEQRLREGT